MIVESFPPLPMSIVKFTGGSLTQQGRVSLESSGLSGAQAPSFPELKDRLSFGAPVLTSIGTNYHAEDNDLQTFIANTQERWFLAHMALDFLEGDGPRLESATVQVNLGDDGAHPDTIAFSILPLRASAPVGGALSFTLNPSVAGISVGALGWEPAPARVGKVFLTGKGELSSRVTWTFKRRRKQHLDCSTRLIMIIKSPKDCQGRISIGLGASVRTGKLFRRRSTPLVNDTATNSYDKTF